MTENTTNPNEPRKLTDAELNEVAGGGLPDFMYELAEKFEPKTQEEILHRFHNYGDIEAPYRFLITQLRRIHDSASVQRVKNYFYERYDRELRG